MSDLIEPICYYGSIPFTPPIRRWMPCSNYSAATSGSEPLLAVITNALPAGLVLSPTLD